MGIVSFFPVPFRSLPCPCGDFVGGLPGSALCGGILTRGWWRGSTRARVYIAYGGWKDGWAAESALEVNAFNVQGVYSAIRQARAEALL